MNLLFCVLFADLKFLMGWTETGAAAAGAAGAAGTAGTAAAAGAAGGLEFLGIT